MYMTYMYSIEHAHWRALTRDFQFEVVWNYSLKKSSGLNGVQIYDLSYIHLHSSSSTGLSRCDQLLVGMIAQLVEHCTGIAEVMGSNPVQACLSCMYNCDDHSCLHIFLRSSNIWSFINLFAQNQYVELAKPKSAAPGPGDSSEPERVNPG